MMEELTSLFRIVAFAMRGNILRSLLSTKALEFSFPANSSFKAKLKPLQGILRDSLFFFHQNYFSLQSADKIFGSLAKVLHLSFLGFVKVIGK